MSLPPGMGPPDLTKIPMCPVPEGVIPDFSDAAANIEYRIYTVFAVVGFFSTLFLILRLYTRILITRAAGWEDRECALEGWWVGVRC